MHALVREAAARTGASQTSVVETALRQYLAGLGDERSQRRRDERLVEFYAELDASRIGARIPAVTDLLYDPQTGFPS